MSLSDERRAQLGAIADQLIPAGAGMPSASEAGVAGQFLDEVLAARPDLGGAAGGGAGVRATAVARGRDRRAARGSGRAGASSPRSFRRATS